MMIFKSILQHVPFVNILQKDSLLPVKLQAFDGNITFFRCLNHVLDKIGLCHSFSGLQVQCQSFCPVHLVIDTGACGDLYFCFGDGFRRSIGEF